MNEKTYMKRDALAGGIQIGLIIVLGVLFFGLISAGQVPPVDPGTAASATAAVADGIAQAIRAGDALKIAIGGLVAAIGAIVYLVKQIIRIQDANNSTQQKLIAEISSRPCIYSKPPIQPPQSPP